MELMQLAILVLVFIASVVLVLWLGQVVSGNPANKRVRQLVGSDAAAPQSAHWVNRLAQETQRLAKLSMPEDDLGHSALRRRFFNAGLRSTAAPVAYFGVKTALAIVLPLFCYAGLTLVHSPLKGDAFLVLLLVCAGLGYYLPNVALSRMVFLRQREVFETFPDALDLMTVCVEAGLGTEAALNRVAEEMGHRSRALSEELSLVGMELRAGAPREHALHNLAMRTGVEEVEGFVSMVVQAERFGTSIAQALRVHADMLRTRRRQRAEEAAAKIALKLLFPLIFFIFPSLMLVLMGPAMIQIYRVLLPTMSGTGI
jgi:tight adherence protein C